MTYNIKQFLGLVAISAMILSCNENGTKAPAANDSNQVNDTTAATYDTTFKVEAEAFADLQVLRYQVPGFSQLSLQQKQLSYYLYEASLAGRDIFYDQKSKYGILLRKTLETIYQYLHPYFLHLHHHYFLLLHLHHHLYLFSKNLI